VKTVYYYETNDHEFMKKLEIAARAIQGHGGGTIFLSDKEYDQAKRIAKTANVFQRKWFKLYYRGILLQKEKVIDGLQQM
jgi:hypothetical protein